MGVGRRMDGIYTIEFKRLGKQQSLSALEKDTTVPHVKHARTIYADRGALDKIAGKNAVQDMNMRLDSVLDDCSLCAETPLTDTLMLSRTYAEVRPVVVIHTNVAALNVRR